MNRASRWWRSGAAGWMLAWGLAVVPARAGEWAQYRGPDHNGISTEVIRTNWTAEPPREVWRIPLGAGLGSFSVSQGVAVTMEKRGAQEYVVALDAATGTNLWATAVDVASYNSGVDNTDDALHNGPRGTPTIDGDRVYAFGGQLKLACLRLSDGGVEWSRDLKTDFGGSVIAWQNASSPLLEGDLLFVNCNAGSGGRLLAVDKVTGTNVWRVGSGDRMTQSTPVITTLGGVRQVVFLAQSGLVSAVPETGALLWRYPFSYSTSTGASPVVGDGMVYCSAAYGVGAGMLEPVLAGDTWSTNRTWRKSGTLQNHWCTPVYWKGYLYGHYNQSGVELACVDMATGTETWAVGQTSTGAKYRYGAVLMAGDYLIATTGGDTAVNDGGVLVLIDPDPTEYREIDRYRALTGKCWNSVALSDGRIYFRSTLEAVCLDVSVPPPPLPLLRLEAQSLAVSGGTFKLTVRAADGGELPPGGLGNTEVLASTNVALPLLDWSILSLTPVYVNGAYELEDTGSTGYLRRSYLLRSP